MRHPEIRLYRLSQAFGSICGQRLSVLDAARYVDANYLDGAEACINDLIAGLKAMADKLGPNNPIADEYRKLAAQLYSTMNPHWEQP